ncbi:hypothetical protein [Nonomuraea jiangxiensis]|uniref:MYXO-CTERM domain-containing protein n=1 Tax=Nonomuraea jiangxiensis TaxID=633440 RepID=A0A1G8FNN2_9ACTN|nr:hypothetical protein [Nonomuraea jiangxiensis]SDH83755.1 hypothetical protein SAMN05421869_103376 [Nonomuraea jiangxiensis]
MQRMTGLLVGALFGAVFVIANAHDPLNPVAVTIARAAAALGLCGVVVLGRRARAAATGQARPAAGRGPRNMFGRGYWLVVAAEAILLFGGIALLRAWGQPEEANVAWIAVIVGIHFVVLAPVWRQPSIAVPGVLLTVVGVAGLVMAQTSAVAWTPVVAGVLSGVTLLVSCIAAAWSGSRSGSASPKRAA